MALFLSFSESAQLNDKKIIFTKSVILRAADIPPLLDSWGGTSIAIDFVIQI